MLYDVFDETVFDEIFGTSTYYPVLQQALFHCAPRSDIQNFFLAWAPANMGVLRTVVGDAYLMYLVYNAYPTFFTTQVMDNFGVEEFYRAFERMANFNISDLMALLQNSMEPQRYDDFAASVPSFLTYEEKISLSEQYIYGSQRLGTKRGAKQLQSHTLRYESGNWLPEEVNILAEPVPAYVAQAGGLVDVGYGLGTWLANGKLKYPQEATYTRKLGLKEYELSNHLGNIQATILDRRLGIKTNPSDTIFSYVEADVKTAQDYYPFGMIMPGRSYTASSTLSYRYGMNGQERDDEIYGAGNSYSAEFWQYDARIGRRWNVDPVIKHGTSLYSTFSNNPIIMVDPSGADDYYNRAGKWVGNDGQGSGIRLINAKDAAVFAERLNQYGVEQIRSVSQQVTIQENAAGVISKLYTESQANNREMKAYFILDTKNATLSVVPQPSSSGDTKYQSENKFDGKLYFGVVPFKVPEGGQNHEVIVGQIHGHPDPEATMDDMSSGSTTNFVELRQTTSSHDESSAKKLGVPVHAIDFTGKIHRVDQQGVKMDGMENSSLILRESLEISGGKPK